MRAFRYIAVRAAALSFATTCLPVQADESDKGGLPQLDTSLFPEQLFWLAISFCLLYLLMSRMALPRVARTQTNRQQAITTALDAARTANDNAKAAVAQLEKSLADARTRAHVEMAAVVAQVTADSATRAAAQDRELGTLLQRAEADIVAARETAMKAVRGSAAELASAIFEKITGAKMRVGA